MVNGNLYVASSPELWAMFSALENVEIINFSIGVLFSNYAG